MTAPPIRVLIVDDSASMRAVLKRTLSADPEIEVIGVAPEPDTARAMIKDLNPDVITLDIEMPGMDGLSFLEKIMRLRPMPVVMCSTLTARGAEATIEALRLGAVDCIAKPTGFAARLDSECTLRVVEAQDGTPIERGTVYIAPGGQKHMELAGGLHGRIKLRAGEPHGGHRPSVDILFESVASLGSAAVGVMLTGMGADGATGLLAMRRAGARTLGQSKDTCVVYGMPRAAFALGAVEREVPLTAMPGAILGACRK